MTKAATGSPELGTREVYHRLARNSAWLGGGTVLSALLTMLAVVLSARALSPREFGLLVLFQSATLMVTTFMSFSTQQPVIKLGAAAQAAGDLDHLGRIFGLGLAIDTAAAIVAALSAFTFLNLGSDWLGIPDGEMRIAGLFAGSLLFSGYLTSNGIFRLLNRFALLSLIQTGCAAFLLAATACLYALNAPFEAYCLASVAFFVLNSLLPLIIGVHQARKAGIRIRLSKAEMRAGELRTFLAYCWTTWGAATVEALRSNGDSLLVGATVSVESAGIYNVAKQLAGVLRKLSSVYASAAFPEISTLAARGEHQTSMRLRRRMIGIGAVVGCVAFVGALLLGGLALKILFGARFAPAYVPLAILTAAAGAQLISQTQTIYVQVYVGPERLLAGYLVALAVFLLAAVPLTLSFSMAGTATAQLLFTLALITICTFALRGPVHAA